MARHHARTAASWLGVLLAAFLLAPGGSRAADPAPVAALQLRDGRVLHDAMVIADEGDSVVIRANEGLIKLAKADLPQALAASYPAPTPTPEAAQMVMVPFNPSPADIVPEPDARPKPKPAPANVPNPLQSNGSSFKGCTIVSFQPKSFQNAAGCAEVVIANTTDTPVVIFPRNIVCMTSGGARHQGRFIVTDGFPPTIKRRDVVPAQGTVDDIFTFTNDALDIAGVQWAR
jgi:hypothetical protein